MRYLSILLLIAGCSYDPAQTQFTPMMSAYEARTPAGNPVAGHETFHKFRCDTCHSVAGEKRQAQVPLRDFSRETPDAVANLIASHTELAPEALFDEMAMSATASALTQQELTDIVAYLRNPSAAKKR